MSGVPFDKHVASAQKTDICDWSFCSMSWNQSSLSRGFMNMQLRIIKYQLVLQFDLAPLFQML